MRWLRPLLRFLRGESPCGESAPPEAEQAIPTRGSDLPTTIVNVGLDFGTSGTKVVVRLLEGERPAWAVDFGTDLAGFSRFGLPSTVAVDGSRFLFGSDAEDQQDGSVWRSLKRTLIEESGGDPPTSLAERPPRPQDLDGHPVFLVAAYFAAVIRRVYELVEEEYSFEPEYFYNLDIPVSELGGGAVQRAFQSALDAAVDFAETDHLRIDDCDAVWARWLEVLGRDTTGVSDPEQERWSLVPESVAVVKGAEAALAAILPGSLRYTAIVDIGAGTTDMGWFNWVARDEGDCLPFFAASVCLVGCDDVDGGLLDALTESTEDRRRLLSHVREAKPALNAGRDVHVGRGLRSLTAADLRPAVREVAGRCFKEYRVSFGEAYSKHPNTDYWQEIRVILVGGGSQLEGFRHQFRRHPRQHFGRKVDFLVPGRSGSVGSTVKTLGARGDTRVPTDEGDIVFLLPALGLSYPVEEMPDLKHPEDISPLPPPPTGPTGHYDYEAPDD